LKLLPHAELNLFSRLHLLFFRTSYKNNLLLKSRSMYMWFFIRNRCKKLWGVLCLSKTYKRISTLPC